MQTLGRDFNSLETTIYTDRTAKHGNENGGSGIIVTTGRLVTREFTLSVLFLLANGACPSKPKRKLCKWPINWYRRIFHYTRCASFRTVCQHSSTYKICTHPNRLLSPTKTRFSTLWPYILRESAISLSHVALAILGSVGMLADVVAKEDTTVKQGVRHLYELAKMATQCATMAPPTTHDRLCLIYGKRG